MSVRAVARSARLTAERTRLELWARRLDARLRRAGGRLRLEAPHGAHFYALPVVEVHPYGPGAGTLTIRLGRHAHLGRGLILEIWAGADSLFELGDDAALRAGERLQLRGGAIRIGRGTTIRDYGLLDVMRGGEIAIGDYVQMGSQVALHAVDRVQLDAHVTIGERTSIFDSDHRHDGSEAPVVDQPVAVAPVTIGANSFVGANSLVLRGATLAANCSVAGGAVVRAGEYPGGHLYAGSPARAVRRLV